MLTKVEIKNINAIRNSEFDFSKAKYQYKNNMVFNDEIVNPIAFYGTNGSGKSSFLTAISQLISLMADDPSQLRAFVPHLRSTKKKDKFLLQATEKSSIKLFFKIQKVNYVYFVETSIQGYISREKLICNNEEVFVRNKDIYSYNGNEKKVPSEMFPILRTLNLETNDQIIHLCYEFLSNIGFIDASKKTYQLKISLQKSYKDIIVENSNAIKAILSKYKEFPLYDVYSATNELGEKEYYVNIKHKSGELVLPWSVISSGMENQSMLLSAVLSLPENGVLIIDELEDALHPLSIIDFINAVKEKNIQLIFSSHNTYILQSLRPDQIIFAHWEEGYSKYKRLSEIYPNIREVNNIEKMYLSNLFDEDIKK